MDRIFNRVSVKIPVLFVLAFALSLTAFAQTTNTTITEWSELGLAKGSENLFRPDDSITRAEFITLINRVFGYSVKSDLTYTDEAVEAGIRMIVIMT